jgi:hypothetical protein
MNPLPIAPVSNVALLAAALELQRTHGTEFAVLFLEPYGFDPEVIKALLHPNAPLATTGKH